METKHTLKNAESATAQDGVKFNKVTAGHYSCNNYQIIKRDAKELGHEDPIFPRFEWFVYKPEMQGALDIVGTLREAKEVVLHSIKRNNQK